MLKKYNLCFTLISPFMTGSNEAASFGVDENLPLDEKKHVVFPGTLLRGVLHDVLHSCNYENLDKLFGKASDDKYNTPMRGKIIFGDFKSVKPVDNEKTLTRIKINPDTGSVEKGAIQVISLPFGVGDEVEFHGAFYLDEDLISECDNILKAFKLIPSLGSFKSAGFGRVINWDKHAENEALPSEITLIENKRYIFNLKIDAPFLVNAKRVADNVFEGSVTISGGAIKGAIARALGVNKYENLIIKEARPLNTENERAPVLPFNLEHEGKYQIDWKQKDKAIVFKKYPHYLQALDIKYESRTRTAIDYENNTAKEGEVFVYNLVKPDNHIWQFEIIAKEAMSLALDNLRIFIGKMDTPAMITKVGKQEYCKETVTSVTLKLETDCIMFDEDCDLDDLQKTYGGFFKEIGTLESFHARQEMLGGWQALRARRKQNVPYYPLFVTKAGSVFTLENVNQDELNLALNEGLRGYNQSNDYEAYPLSNGNGFGEISLMETKNAA